MIRQQSGEEGLGKVRMRDYNDLSIILREYDLFLRNNYSAERGRQSGKR